MKDEDTKNLLPTNHVAYDDAALEQEMKDLAAEFKDNSEFVENNLVVIQKTDTRIDDFENKNHKFYLKALYGLAKHKKDFVYATMVKGLLRQNKLFDLTPIAVPVPA